MNSVEFNEELKISLKYGGKGDERVRSETDSIMKSETDWSKLGEWQSKAAYMKYKVFYCIWN